MFDFFVEFFSQDFMIYALIIGLSLGLGAALLSSFLVLNNQSMIADGLSHIAFTGIIFGLLAFPNQPIYLALPIAISASIAITYLGQLKMIEYDSSIGVISAFTLAVGLIAISVAKDGFNQSIESLLTGVILSSSTLDVILSIVALGIVLVFVIIFYRSLLSSSYDPVYAQFSKVKHNLLRYLLSALVATFIVLGVRTIGMLLISSFIIFPSLIAAQISKSFKQNVFIGMIVAFVVIVIGMFASFEFDLPTGSTIVVTYTITLVFAIIYRKIFRRA